MELGLRVLGEKLLDLSLTFYNPSKISEILNHTPIAGSEIAILPDGSKLSYTYDKNGIRTYSNNRNKGRAQTLKILFLGDSFMQGGEEENSIPYIVETQLEKSFKDLDVIKYNAGFSSYSPSIFTLQARRLIPLIKPDITVVDIDETDLGDENYRYASLRQVDATGKLLAVKSVPEAQAIASPAAMSRDSNIYLVRLGYLLYIKYILKPKLEKNFRATPLGVLAYYQNITTDLRIRIKSHLDYFELRVEELISELLDLSVSRDKIMIVHHPHLHHLTPNSQGMF